MCTEVMVERGRRVRRRGRGSGRSHVWKESRVEDVREECFVKASSQEITLWRCT